MATTETTKRAYVNIGVSGDAHLRDTQYARSSRGQDYYDAKVRLIEAASAAGLKVLLDTGDFFNSSRPSPAVVQQATTLDRRLRKMGIAMLSVTGNHDWNTPTWLQVLFGDADPADGGIIPMDDRRVAIDGYVYQGIRPYSPSGYRANEKEILASCQGADVVLMHATVNGVVESGVSPDRMLDLSELPFAPGVKLIALGDLHFMGFVVHRGCLVGYPGSTEMGSSSEPTTKMLPVIRLSDEGATLHDTIPLRIRPFFSPTIRKQEDVDNLIAALTPVADQHPVVVSKFSREFPEVITRTYGLLDAQRAVIRFEPLPHKEENPKERAKAEDIQAHGIEYFLHARFGGSDKSNELELSLALLARGETDAANIVTTYIEKRKQDLALRETEQN